MTSRFPDSRNVGPTDTTGFPVDLTPHTVTPDQSTINANALGSTGFTLGGGVAGDLYSYSISSNSGSGTPVTGSGEVTSASQDIPVDLSNAGFPDGPITFSVVLSDSQGNNPSTVTATATIDREAPTAIALSTSVAPLDAAPGTEVAVLETVGPDRLPATTPTRSSPSMAAPTAVRSRSRSAATSC